MGLASDYSMKLPAASEGNLKLKKIPDPFSSYRGWTPGLAHAHYSFSFLVSRDACTSSSARLVSPMMRMRLVLASSVP
jgi:hypothetical protein